MKTKAEIIDEFIENLTSDEALESIEKDGGLTPAFIFCVVKDEEAHNAILEIPKFFMDGGRAGKELFMKSVYPSIKKKIKDEFDDVYAIAFVSEVWKSKNAEKLNGNDELNESNSEENIMMSFHYETDENKEALNFLYPMMRICGNLKLGKAEMVKNVYGKQEFVGRFSEIF
jgi:hypothetical protein